jgi:very-short-patch-repair endonuclease
LTAVEIEGGVWRGGRHTTGAGFTRDCEKYLAASALGWMVLRLTPDMITRENLAKIHAVIEHRTVWH